MLGQFHKSLINYNDPEFEQSADKEWCIEFVESWECNCDYIEEEKTKSICLDFAKKFKKEIRPVKCKRGVIHNDIAFDNIIINTKSQTPLLALIDFDNVTEGPLLTDLITLLTYLLTDGQS